MFLQHTLTHENRDDRRGGGNGGGGGGYGGGGEYGGGRDRCKFDFVVLLTSLRLLRSLPSTPLPSIFV